MSHNEDRELQIRLAELQADVEINLTARFGFMAVFVPLIILFKELHFSSATSAFIKDVFALFAVASSLFLLVALFFIKRAINARMQMSDLKKKYVW